MGERNWTFTVTLTVPDDVEAGDAATAMADVLGGDLLKVYPEWKVGDLVLVITPDEYARYAGQHAGLGDRDTHPVFTLYRGKLDEIARRAVTDEEVSRIAIALEFSSVPAAIEDVIYSVCGNEDEDE